MDKINVNTREVNETKHFARLSQAQLKALILNAVAKEAGVSLDLDHVKVERCWLTSRSTSNGAEYEAECVIVVDHLAAPQPAAER